MSTLPRKYSKSNQIHFTKINSGTNPLERNIQTISLKVNPQIKFEKKSIKLRTNSSINLVCNNCQSVQNIYKI